MRSRAAAKDASHSPVARESPESLLRIPLVRSMVTDPEVRFARRAVDTGWREAGIVRHDVTGFEPLGPAVYVAGRSRFATWRQDPAASARPHNERDLLLREVLRVAHDYLHTWATRLLQALAPERFVVGRPSIDDVERLTFLHLVTETVATVGLDYWYLCTLRLADVVPIGSTMAGGWSVAYHEAHRDEYRRFVPDLEVQSPAFFARWFRFYCTGGIDGAEPRGLVESPLLLRWLEHELRYASVQRKNARRWFRFLATGEVSARVSDARPMRVDEPWMGAIVRDVGLALWNATRAAAFRCEPFVPALQMRGPSRAAVDARFCVWSGLSEKERAAVLDASLGVSAFAYWSAQLIAATDHDAAAPVARATIHAAVRARSLRDVATATAGLRRVDGPDAGPRHIFFPG